MLQVEFPEEPGWPCVQVPRWLLPRIGLLSDRPCWEQSVELSGVPGVTAMLLSQLCDLLVDGDKEDDGDAMSVTGGLEHQCLLLYARHALALVDADKLDLRLRMAIATQLAGLRDTQLLSLIRDSPHGTSDPVGDLLTESQLEVREPLYLARLCARAYALRAYLPHPALVRQCMSVLPVPSTSLAQLATAVGLSGYMVRAVYDLIVRASVTRASDDVLYIVAPASHQLRVINAAAYVGEPHLERLSEGRLLKYLLRAADTALQKRVKRGELTKAEKDWTLISQFLGWGMTRTGHAVYLYYRGPSSRRPSDLARVEYWRAPPLDTLRYFHSRLGKELDTLWRSLSSVDVYGERAVTAGERYPHVDVRYLAHRWARRHGEALAVVRENGAPLLEALQII